MTTQTETPGECATVQSPRGTLTFCRIDGPDDRWAWAIVTGYRGDPQQPGYDVVRMMFAEGYEPLRADLQVILAAMEVA